MQLTRSCAEQQQRNPSFEPDSVPKLRVLQVTKIRASTEENINIVTAGQCNWFIGLSANLRRNVRYLSASLLLLSSGGTKNNQLWEEKL